MTDTPKRSTEDRLDELESRWAIAELLAHYSEGADMNDIERFMSVWHDDGVYLLPGKEFNGADAIRASQEPSGKAWKASFHWIANHSVRFESKDRAIGRADAFGICAAWDDRVHLASGTYDDVYERRDGEWKFARRAVGGRFVSTPSELRLTS